MPVHTPIGLAFLYSLRAISHKVLGQPEKRESPFIRLMRALGVVIGVVIVSVLIREVGWAQIRHSLGMLGWGYGIVVLYPISWILLNTAGWKKALHAQYESQPLWRLAAIRLAGETFNSLLPSGYVGGEPLKAKLLAGWVPLHEAASSVLIAKAAQSVGLVLFVGLGLTFGGHGTVHHRSSTWIALGFLTVGISIFMILLTNRSFSRMGRWLHRLTGHPWLQKQEARLVALDDSIGAFYREGKTRFFASVLWHMGGWLAGAFEVAVIFFLIGHRISFANAWFIGAMAQLAAVIGLFAPAGVGLYEGGHYLAASMLGLPPALGVSVALIRRVREIVWDVVGLGLFWKLSKIMPATAEAASVPETPRPLP